MTREAIEVDLSHRLFFNHVKKKEDKTDFISFLWTNIVSYPLK